MEERLNNILEEIAKGQFDPGDMVNLKNVLAEQSAAEYAAKRLFTASINIFTLFELMASEKDRQKISFKRDLVQTFKRFLFGNQAVTQDYLPVLAVLP